MKWFIAAACCLATQALADWSVKDGSLSIVHSGDTLETVSFDSAGALHLPTSGSIELKFQTLNDNKGARAHQTFAQLVDEQNNRHFSFAPSKVSSAGQAKISIPWSKIPPSLQSAEKLTLQILVASFGNSQPLRLAVTKELEIDSPASIFKAPERLSQLPEIIHQFRADPKRVAAPIALAFVGVAGFLLFSVLGFFGKTGSISVIGDALEASPFGHIGLLGSLISLEAVFLLYFSGMSIFGLLTAVFIIVPIAVIAGSRALREVRARREANKF